MADHRPTFKERFSEIFMVLEERECGPVWERMATLTTWPPARPVRGIWQSRPPEPDRSSKTLPLRSRPIPRLEGRGISQLRKEVVCETSGSDWETEEGRNSPK